MKVQELIQKLLVLPPDADILIEQYEDEASVPWYRLAYNPTYNQNVPYPASKKEHPNGVVVL